MPRSSLVTSASLAVWLGCGPTVVSPVDSASNSGSATVAETTSDGSADSESRTSDAVDCFAAGGRLDIVDGPRFIDDVLGELDGTFYKSLGLIVRADGLWATFGRRDPAEEDLVAAYGVQLDRSGWPSAPAEPRELPWGVGIVSKGPGDRAIVLYCHADLVGWVFIDLDGRPVSDPMTFDNPPFCDWDGLARGLYGPRAAWTSRGDAVVAWVRPDAEGVAWHVAAAGVDERGLGTPQELHSAWSVGATPSLAIAAGSNSALVVQHRRSDGPGEHEIVSTLVDATGKPLGPPISHPFPESDGDPELHAVAEESGDFFVYVGNAGLPLGVMRFSQDGTVLDPLHGLPTTEDPDLSHVYGSLLGVARGPGVHYVYGSAWDGFNAVLVTAYDVGGRHLGEVTTTGTSAAITHDGERTWLLMDYAGSGLQMAELGCVLPS